MNVTKELDVEVAANLANARPDTPLRIDEDARPFLDELERRDGGRFVRYRVRLAEAARSLEDVDVAYPTEDVVFAPASTWLMRPAGVPAMGRFRFHVTTPEGVVFMTGVHRAKDANDGSTYEGAVPVLEDVSFAAFGALDVHRLPGTQVDVAITKKGLGLSEASILRWLALETEAVARYFEQPDSAVLFVAPGKNDVTRGKTLGDGGPAVLFRMGTSVDAEDLLEDWVAAHELVHVAMPTVPPQHAWFAEGLATYVEPIVRVRAGLITVEKFWADLLAGLPSGLPKPDDSNGLDGTEDQTRIYWGGAIYFFLADVFLRDRTHGAKSLDDALRGIKRAAGNAETRWSLARVIEEGDSATGTHVLGDLHEDVARKRFSPDLDKVFRDLGVKRGEKGKILFDEEARSAQIRRGITAGLPRKKDLR